MPLGGFVIPWGLGPGPWNFLLRSCSFAGFAWFRLSPHRPQKPFDRHGLPLLPSRAVIIAANILVVVRVVVVD
jgi:hypothetical protein